MGANARKALLAKIEASVQTVKDGDETKEGSVLVNSREEDLVEAPVQNAELIFCPSYDSEAQARAICMSRPECKGYLLHKKGKFYLLNSGHSNYGGEAWTQRVMVKRSVQALAVSEADRKVEDTKPGSSEGDHWPTEQSQ